MNSGYDFPGCAFLLDYRLRLLLLGAFDTRPSEVKKCIQNPPKPVKRKSEATLDTSIGTRDTEGTYGPTQTLG